MEPYIFICLFFFFNDTATTEIYTLSLHDALPIYADHALGRQADFLGPDVVGLVVLGVDRGQQAFLGQLVDLGQQLPGPLERLALEVVAEGPVAQHLEEGVVGSEERRAGKECRSRWS